MTKSLPSTTTFGTDIQLNANVDFTEKQTDMAQALRTSTN